MLTLECRTYQEAGIKYGHQNKKYIGGGLQDARANENAVKVFKIQTSIDQAAPPRCFLRLDRVL
jgi:hypothetical protein